MTAAPNAMLGLYRARHSQTGWSLSRQRSGITAIRLTAQGEPEARAVIPWIEPIPLRAVLTSPRQRAQCTCKKRKH